MSENTYLRGRIWWGRIQVDGVVLKKSLRTSSRAKARELARAWKEEVDLARVTGQPRLIWDDAVLRYLTEIVPGAIKDSTADRYKVSLRQVLGFLEGKVVASLGMKDIAELVGERKKQGATNATIKRDLTAVSRVFAACQTWEACEHNPAQDFLKKGTIRERRDPIVLPTAAEIETAIEKAPNDSWRSILRIAKTTGMRQGEIISLHVRQVDLERKAVSLDKTKTDSPRVVSLEPPIRDQAAATFAATLEKVKSGLVFPSPSGEEYANFSSNYNQWASRAGVTFRFHDLRHFFAVSYLRAGGDIYDLQKTLGHASIKTTEIYLAYLTPQEQKAGGKRTATETATA